MCVCAYGCLNFGMKLNYGVVSLRQSLAQIPNMDLRYWFQTHTKKNARKIHISASHLNISWQFLIFLPIVSRARCSSHVQFMIKKNVFFCCCFVSVPWAIQLYFYYYEEVNNHVYPKLYWTFNKFNSFSIQSIFPSILSRICIFWFQLLCGKQFSQKREKNK